MKSPSLPLQAAIFAASTGALGDDAGVYDRVPVDAAGKVTAPFPYASIGDDQIVSDADQCHDACTAFATVHVWSRAVGKVEAKTLMARLCLVLDAKLTVEGFNVIGAKVATGPECIADRDGLTSHAFATFEYLMEPSTDD